MSLSVREKILVFLLIIAALVFIGIKYLVTPAMQDAANGKAKLSDLFNQQVVVQQKVAAAKSADSNLQKELATANSAASAILPQPDNELLNVWIVNLVQGSGLNVTTVSFSQAAVTDITPQNNTASNTQAGSTGGYLLKDYADSYKSVSPSSGAGSQAAATEGGLLCVNVTINMTGTYDQAKAFLDAVKNCGKTAIVNAFTCSVDNNKVYTISAVIACYGAEKLDDSDSTFAWTQPQPAGNNDLM
jgi:Tfp pilus assembly protein PilO